MVLLRLILTLVSFGDCADSSNAKDFVRHTKKDFVPHNILMCRQTDPDKPAGRPAGQPVSQPGERECIGVDACAAADSSGTGTCWLRVAQGAALALSGEGPLPARHAWYAD